MPRKIRLHPALGSVRSEFPCFNEAAATMPRKVSHRRLRISQVVKLQRQCCGSLDDMEYQLAHWALQ
jgi:hypothetical protein